MKVLKILLLLILIVVVTILLLLIGAMPQVVSNTVTTAVAVLGIILVSFQAKSASQQAEKASQQVEQTLTTDVLFRLYGMYVQRDMHQAIRDVWQIIKQKENGAYTIGEFLAISDRYQFLKEYIEAQADVDKNRLDESRRMVTHFWYLIANLLNEGVFQEKDVFEWFGPPDIIWILEGLEVIKQNVDLTVGRKKTRWPPLQVLDAYYRSKGINIADLKNHTIPIARIEQEMIKQINEL